MYTCCVSRYTSRDLPFSSIEGPRAIHPSPTASLTLTSTLHHVSPAANMSPMAHAATCTHKKRRFDSHRHESQRHRSPYSQATHEGGRVHCSHQSRNQRSTILYAPAAPTRDASASWNERGGASAWARRGGRRAGPGDYAQRLLLYDTVLYMCGAVTVTRHGPGWYQL